MEKSRNARSKKLAKLESCKESKKRPWVESRHPNKKVERWKGHDERGLDEVSRKTTMGGKMVKLQTSIRRRGRKNAALKDRRSKYEKNEDRC